jgi:hypothetical protein
VSEKGCRRYQPYLETLRFGPIPIVLDRCLQEISYLTSAAALNPLPNKLAFDLSLPRPASPSVNDDKEKGQGRVRPQQAEEAPAKPPVMMEVPPRPKKVLEEQAVKPKAGETSETKADAVPFPSDKQENESVPAVKEATSAGTPAEDKSTAPDSAASSASASEARPTDRRSGSEWIGSSASSSSSKDSTGDDSQDVLTAIYKPESREVWKKALQAANDKAEKVCGIGRFLPIEKRSNLNYIAAYQAQREAKAQIESGTLSKSRFNCLTTSPRLTDCLDVSLQPNLPSQPNRTPLWTVFPRLER